MATSPFTSTRPHAWSGQLSSRGRWSGGRVFGALWKALAELGKQRAHREIAFLLQAHGGQVTGDFDRDLQRYIELSVVRVGPKQDRC